MNLCSNTIQKQNAVIKSLKSKTKRLLVQINTKENLILNLKKKSLISGSAEDVLAVRYSVITINTIFIKIMYNAVSTIKFSN